MPRELEAALEGADSAYAAELAVQLLRIYRGKDSRSKIDEFSWESELVRQVELHRTECGLDYDDANPLAIASFGELGTEEKVKVLNWICEWSLAEKETVRDLVVYDEGQPPFKSEPIGSDGTYIYWCFVYEERVAAHIYRERKEAYAKDGSVKTAAEWRLVATGIDEVESLLETLNRLKVKSKTARHNLSQLKTSLQELLPVLQRNRRKAETLARQSKKLGLDMNQIIHGSRQRRASKKVYQEWSDDEEEY